MSSPTPRLALVALASALTYAGACTGEPPDPLEDAPGADVGPRRDASVAEDVPLLDGSTASDAGRDAGTELPVAPCDPATIAPGTSVSGYLSDLVTWRDARCLPRTAALVHNDVRDPSGHYGGLVRRFTYEVGGGTRTVESNNDGHPGFGEVVNHFDSSATISSGHAGTYETLLSGPHHVIHAYHWRYAIQGHDVNITVHWFFATGRDHPVYAITFDLTGVPEGAVRADTRSPYGDVQWDGGGSTPVSGVGWGDRYRFSSLGAPVSMASGWTYEDPNRVPYVIEWTVAPDAEMGLVQTETNEDHAAGGYWFYSAWGTRDGDGPMPEDWNWTYQLNQYELPFPGGNVSKRLAWGMNYGAVGESAYSVYGDDGTASGWPYQSYATFVVLGAHSESAVFSQVSDVEALVDARVSARTGSVVARGPGGVGRTDDVARAIPGYDPRYGTFELRAAANAVALTLTPSAPIHWPILEIHDWTAGAPSHVTVNGTAAATASTVDTATDTLWLTVAVDVTAATEIAVSE
jgi:hypothetical protein